MGLIPKEYKEKYKEDVGGGVSYYFNASEIDTENGTKVRAVPWLYKGKRISALAIYEGWEFVPAKGKEKEHNRPIRFEIGEDIPDNIQWAMSDGRFGKPKAQVPKPCIVFLGYFPKEKAIKLSSFTQTGIVNPILAITDDENPDNNLYVSSDLSVTDLILTKKEEGSGKHTKITYGCVAKNTQDPKTPKEALELLEEFRFSFEEYMAGRDAFNEENALTFTAVSKVAYEGFSPKAAQPRTEGSPANKVIADEKLKNWRDIQTPKGTPLGELGLVKLEELKNMLEEKGKTNVDLYHYVAYGVQNFENETPINIDLGNDDIPF